MEGGAKRTWKGFSAFPIIGTKEEGFECHSPVRLVVGDGSVLPCGRCIPRCPAALHTEYWGAHGYSSWCRSELMALVEAQSSQSRGVRTIKAGPRPTAGLWLMLELELEAEEVCGLVQDHLMFCSIEQGGIGSWRIFKTLAIPALADSHSRQTDPPAIGKLSKSVVEWDWHAQATINGRVIEYETWVQGWAFRDKFELSLPTITFDHCLRCQTYMRLLNGMCHLCWNARIPMPGQFRWQLQPRHDDP